MSPQPTSLDPHASGRRDARRTAFRLLFRAFPRRTSLLLLLAVLAGLMPSVFAALVGVLIHLAPDAAGRGFGSPAGHQLILTLVAIGLVLVLQEIVSGAESLMSIDMYRRFDGYLFGRLIELTTRWDDLDLFDDPEKAAQVDRARRIADYGPGEFVSGMQTKYASRAGGIASAILLATVVPWYYILAIVLPLTIIWVALSYALQASHYRADPFWANPLRRANYLQRIGLLPEWAKEVRIFGLVGWITDRYSTEWRRVIETLQESRRADRGMLLAWTAGLLLANAAALALLVRSAWIGAMSVAALAVAVQAFLGLAALASQNGDVWIENGAAAMPELVKYQALIDSRASAPARRTDVSGPLPRDSLSFDGVGFTYPGRASALFESFDLRIEAGTSLAIVGLNGAGKTTLAKLLTGLCRPDHGRIAVDGVDLADLDMHVWRRSVAAIFQDFTRYELSARDNIAFGAVDSLGQRGLDDRLVSAGRDAGARDVLERLPHGLDTVLSRRFPGGVDLSGGQWQRIALARALMATANGARVLVLDEPTAHLDVRAEVDLFDRFLELTHGLTTVLISHRFSTVRRADRIVVLEHGRVIEDGSHDELVAHNGRYAAMFRLQAERYRRAGDVDD
ncbi:MAG: ABC transporter ATP-binding protein [Mycobacteriales bacterium]